LRLEYRPISAKKQSASTGVPADDALLLNDAPMARYPVDDITEKQNCELHQKMANLSMKVAVGFAIPSAPGQLFHCHPILAGYARVWVDEVMKGFEGLELHIPGGEGEVTLGELVVSFFGERKTLCFQTWHQGSRLLQDHRLLQVHRLFRGTLA
jgi:hypothetical protein